MDLERSLKVLHIDTELTWRGGQNQLHLLVSGLNQLGVQNHCAFQPDASYLARFAGLCQVTTIVMRNSLSLLAVLKIIAYCIKNEIDILHAHTSRAHALALIVKAFCRKLKLVVHKRVEPAAKLSLFQRLQYLSKLVDRYIVISSFIAKRFHELGVHPGKIILIPSGTKLTSLNVKSQKELRGGVIVFGTASHLSQRKGQDIFIKALGLLKENKQWCARIAGEGELRPILESQTRDLGIKERVEFCGFVNDITEYFRGLDVFILPSRWEGLGSSLIEAAAQGCCLVASNVGGIPDVVEHEKSGLLFASEDFVELSRHLMRLIKSPHDRARLALQANEHVRQNFDERKTVELTYKAYLAL